MLSVFDSIILGMIQGITEFLPISSSGHLIIMRDVIGITQNGGLAFDSVLQLATACAVLLYFRKDIIELVLNIFKKNKDSQKTKLTIALIVGTIPAIILGLYLQDYMETIFRSTGLVAVTLIVGAVVMFIADLFLNKRKSPEEDLTLAKGLGVGLYQCLALVPGMSRSGMSISGGYFLGLSKEMAVRFSFLLSIPIIVGSGLVKLFDIIKDPSIVSGGFTTLSIGFISAFVFGWISIDFLLKFLKTNSFKVFVIYRIVLAGVLLIFFI